MNPVSAELLQRIKRWVSRPSGPRPRLPGTRCSARSPGFSCSASATPSASSTSPPRAPYPPGAARKKSMTTRVFPIALVLEGRPCLVVGSNADAAQRAEALFQAGARGHRRRRAARHRTLLRLEQRRPRQARTARLRPRRPRRQVAGRAHDAESRARRASASAGRRGATRPVLGRRPTRASAASSTSRSPAPVRWSSRSAPPACAPALSRRLREELERILRRVRARELRRSAERAPPKDARPRRAARCSVTRSPASASPASSSCRRSRTRAEDEHHKRPGDTAGGRCREARSSFCV